MDCHAWEELRLHTSHNGRSRPTRLAAFKVCISQPLGVSVTAARTTRPTQCIMSEPECSDTLCSLLIQQSYQAIEELGVGTIST